MVTYPRQQVPLQDVTLGLTRDVLLSVEDNSTEDNSTEFDPLVVFGEVRLYTIASNTECISVFSLFLRQTGSR